MPCYKVKTELKKSMKDEKQAPKDYMRLKKLLDSKEDKRTVDKIIKQEKQHYKSLKHIEKKYSKKKQDKDDKWIKHYYNDVNKWGKNPFL